MDMVAPFSKVMEWSPAMSAFIAIFLGLGFGYFLEVAGFGSAKKLAGVWYGYDFAVIRVMFTAIVVAMLGLFFLHYIGFLDLAKVYVNPTYIMPQIVGGFIFGVGFNVGSYCPGTSGVSCATGKIDGIVFLGGFFIGVIVYSFIYPYIAEFASSTSMGRVLLSDTFGIPAGIVALGVVFIALGAFFFTHYLDKKLGNDSYK